MNVSLPSIPRYGFRVATEYTNNTYISQSLNRRELLYPIQITAVKALLPGPACLPRDCRGAEVLRGGLGYHRVSGDVVVGVGVSVSVKCGVCRRRGGEQVNTATGESLPSVGRCASCAAHARFSPHPSPQHQPLRNQSVAAI